MYSKQMLIDMLPTEWLDLIGVDTFDKPYWTNILNTLNNSLFYPSFNNIFKAFQLVKPSDVKCIIIGQDPYINAGQANGLSFSVNNGLPIPPSLRNIYHELLLEYLKNKNDVSKYINMFRNHGDLSQLAKQGVLFMNTVLTVEPNKSNSHKNIGWEYFTSHVLEMLDQKQTFVVLAWGRQAQSTANNHVHNNPIISSGHPSPLNTTTPFVGCGCFRQANNVLKTLNREPIKWSVLFTNVSEV